MSLRKDLLDRIGKKSNAVRALFILIVAMLIFATGSAVRAGLDGNASEGQGDEDQGHDVYAIGLWGDFPYSDVQAATGVPNLIADMNSQDLEFTAHDGDLKAGNSTPNSTTPTTCSDALYVQALGYFNSLKAPAIFTPGDNDWTDCDRASNGGFSSLERLDHERLVFFSTPFSLGQHHLFQQVQLTPTCLGVSGNVPCVENRRWRVGRVTYATLNIQGSCNNLCDTLPDPAEYAARNAADIAWMQETFAEAKEHHSVAVMLISQGDPGFDATDGTRGPLRNPKTLAETDGQPDGFQTFLLALRDEVVAFEKPVAYVHGDSHYFRIDKPFLNSLGQRLENFTRVETFGDNQGNGTNDVNWIKVLVDSHSREVFSYQQQIVPGNRVAVPAP
jgi:hypothetical protein